MRITIGYHQWGQVHGRFCSSLARTIGYEGRRISEVIDIPSPYVAEGRNKVVHAWLGKTKSKWLLMLDADMEFPEDLPSKMAFMAEAFNLPILGGCYSLGDAGMSLFAASDHEGWVRPLIRVEPNQIYRNLGGAATGCLLIRRDVAEKVRDDNMDLSPWHWFDHDRYPVAPDDVVEGTFNELGFSKQGEDMSFCFRARRSGFEVAGTTHAPLIHHKTRPMVPKDLLPIFKGMKVYCEENPWIAKDEEARRKKEEAQGKKEEAVNEEVP